MVGTMRGVSGWASTRGGERGGGLNNAKAVPWEVRYHVAHLNIEVLGIVGELGESSAESVELGVGASLDAT
jgi:hypothetical protein